MKAYQNVYKQIIEIMNTIQFCVAIIFLLLSQGHMDVTYSVVTRADNSVFHNQNLLRE